MDPDETVVETLERIVVAGVALTAIALDRGATGLDLTFPQWRVILVLGDSANGATISTVAKRIGVTLPATGRQLRRLERRGLVSVAPDDRDRRAARARLTEVGLAHREAILRVRHEALASAVAALALSDEQRQGLQRLASALDGYA